MSKQDKKQTIINAALDCIKESGLQHVTVREITEQAALNTAAINYYFGSKEELLHQALQKHFENLLVDWEVILERQALDFQQGLKVLLREILEEARKNPNLFIAQVYEPLTNKNTDSPFAEQFDRFIRHLLEQKTKSQPDKSVETHQVEIMQLFSGVLFPGLVQHLFTDFDQWDLNEAEHQEQYVEELVNRIMYPN